VRSKLPARARGRVTTGKGISAWVALIVSAAAPATAGVVAWRDGCLATAKQDHDLRVAFLDRAVDSTRTPADRQQVLRFLLATNKDPAMKSWAEAELKRVDERIAELRVAARSLEEGIAKAEKQLVIARLKAQSEGLFNDPEFQRVLASAESSLARDTMTLERVQKEIGEARGTTYVTRASFSTSDVQALCEPNTYKPGTCGIATDGALRFGFSRHGQMLSFSLSGTAGGGFGCTCRATKLAETMFVDEL
jgi:hypothetical protein